MQSFNDQANPPPNRKEVIGAATLFLGDCLDVLESLPPNSVDSVVTDPPYGIRFMGKSWDGADIEKTVATKTRKDTVRPDGWKRHDGAAFAAGTYDLSPSGNAAFQLWTQAWATRAFRILKPGGHLISFASPRTYHRMTCGIEDAGFEIRDQIMWLFGSGFPKSHNLEGEWGGWGTALKPAHEPICFARKPFSGTVADNVEKYGVGALNIDACRIPTDEELREGAGGLFSHLRDGKPYPDRNRSGEASADRRYADEGGTNFAMKPGVRGGDPSGRWPANPEAAVRQPAQPNPFLRYANLSQGIRISYPPGWSRQEQEAPGSFMVIFLSPPEDAFDQFLENLNIVIEPLPPQMTLQEYVKICVQQMSQTPLQLQENGPATIAQREAYRCVYTGPLPNQTAGEWMQYPTRPSWKSLTSSCP